MDEFRLAWAAMPGKALFLGLLGSWCLFFHLLGNSTLGYVETRSLFAWLDYSYSQDANDSHGKLIPFVVLGFFWWKRAELLALPKQPAASAMVWVVFGLGLHLLGYLIQQTRISIIGFFVGIYGFIGLAWGWAFLRASFFPFLLFAFCFPLGTLAETLTFPLRVMATQITTFLTGTILGIGVIQDGTTIFDPKGAFKYEVAAACSGLRSVTATLALATIFAFVNVRSPWRRLVIIASAFPLAVLGNVARLGSIIVVAEAFGQEAGNFVHENSVLSLIPYVPALGGLFLLGHFLREPEEVVSQGPGTSPPSSPQAGEACA